MLSAYVLEKIIAHHENDEKALDAIINMKISIPTTNKRDQSEEKR